MTPVQQTTKVADQSVHAGLHLLLTENDVQLTVENPEQVMKQLQMRATQVGALLEGILQERHGNSKWGLNE